MPRKRDDEKAIKWEEVEGTPAYEWSWFLTWKRRLEEMAAMHHLDSSFFVFWSAAAVFYISPKDDRFYYTASYN